MKDVFYDWGGLNAWLFKLVNGLSGNPTYDNFMLFITQFGARENFKYYIGVMVLWSMGEMGLYKMRSVTITRQHTKEAGALLITLVMGYMVCALFVGLPKMFFDLYRPYWVYYNTPGAVHFIGVPCINTGDCKASFPSGHAATIAFIVTALWYKFNYRLAHIAGIVLAFAVCWSRLALGMHFPADVLAGTVIGYVSAYYVRRYVYRMMRVPLPNQQVMVAPVAVQRK